MYLPRKIDYRYKFLELYRHNHFDFRVLQIGDLLVGVCWSVNYKFLTKLKQYILTDRSILFEWTVKSCSPDATGSFHYIKRQIRDEKRTIAEN